MRPMYLSGPMSGLPHHNYPTFHAETARLRALGYTVINPAENFGGRPEHPEGRPAFMRLDVQHILNAQAVAVLPGWHDSRGARLEVDLARELGLPVYRAALLTRYPPDGSMLEQETILEEAQRIVFGGRQGDYGHPRDDFQRTAALWTILLGPKLSAAIEPREVPILMIALKLSREVNKHKRDSPVDIAGYAETLARVEGDDA